MYTSRSTAAPFFAVAVVAGRVSYIKKKDKKNLFPYPVAFVDRFYSPQHRHNRRCTNKNE